MNIVILLKKETHKNRKKKEKFPLTLRKPTKMLLFFLSLMKTVCVRIQLKVSPFVWESYNRSGSDKSVGAGGTLWHDPIEINIDKNFGV